MPMAHSVISLNAEGWSIEALASEPRLVVGGSIVRRAPLHDGDLIQLGPFTLVAHLTAVAQNELLAPIDIPQTLALVGASDRNEFGSGLENVSAEELVDNLAVDLMAAVISQRASSAADALVREAAASEAAAIDEEQLVAEVMAQLSAMSERLAVRDVGDDSVLPLPVREQAADAPLRKSA
jgi:hypothetical protein